MTWLELDKNVRIKSSTEKAGDTFIGVLGRVVDYGLPESDWVLVEFMGGEPGLRVRIIFRERDLIPVEPVG